MEGRKDAYWASTAAWPSASATRLGRLKCEVTVSDVAEDIVVGTSKPKGGWYASRVRWTSFICCSVARTWVCLTHIRLIRFGMVQRRNGSEQRPLVGIIMEWRVRTLRRGTSRSDHQHPGTCGRNEELRCSLVRMEWSNQTRLVTCWWISNRNNCVLCLVLGTSSMILG